MRPFHPSRSLTRRVAGRQRQRGSRHLFKLQFAIAPPPQPLSTELAGYNPRMEVDLNCDLGEGCAHDAELMALITSANVSCGFHAGGRDTAMAALAAAARHSVQVGAHPGFPDREHFGRREHDWPARQVFLDCAYQIGALAGLARAAGMTLGYMKPHGALYNQACRDDALAQAVVDAAVLFGLPVLGLPGSRVEALAAGRCLFVAEGFADRRYQPDGALVPRTRADAFLDDPADAVRQAEWLVRERGVRTVCVHGDNPRALEFVRRLREGLLAAAFHIAPFAAGG